MHEQGGGRRRRPRKFTLPWWSLRCDLPLSTLYRAVQRGFLKACRPRGGSFIVRPQDFKHWYQGDPPATPRPLSPEPAEPRPTGPSATGFKHVRWDELPDDDSGGR